MIISDISVPSSTFTVAVSGGADSLCLTLLAFEAAKKIDVDMTAVFVNHNLRPESSDEIEPVIKLLRSRGVKIKVLSWKHNGIRGNVEKKAREARYDLLTSFCREIKAESVLVAHHSLDQWETFFMRLSKGSGLRGLCAMKSISEYKGINIIRPLLQYTKEDLKQTLREKFGVMDYINDPMNFNPEYERVKWRLGYESLSEKYGLSIAGVMKSMERLRRADNCLESMAEACKEFVFDGVYINISVFKTYHAEIRSRVLLKIIGEVTSQKGRIISYSLLERISNIIIQEDFSAINIANCIFRRDKTKNVKVLIENRKSKNIK